MTPLAPAVQKKKVFYILNIHSKERLYGPGDSRFIYNEPATGGRRTAGNGTQAGATRAAPAALQ